MGQKNKFLYYSIIIFIIFLLTGCKKEQLLKIEIKYTLPATFSSVPVNCDIFEYAFKNIIKEKTLVDKKLLKNADSCISNFIQLDNSVHVDTRIKCFLVYSQKTDTVCISSAGDVALNGKLVGNEEKFVAFIRDQIYSDLK